MECPKDHPFLRRAGGIDHDAALGLDLAEHAGLLREPEQRPSGLLIALQRLHPLRLKHRLELGHGPDLTTHADLDGLRQNIVDHVPDIIDLLFLLAPLRIAGLPFLELRRFGWLAVTDLIITLASAIRLIGTDTAWIAVVV